MRTAFTHGVNQRVLFGGFATAHKDIDLHRFEEVQSLGHVTVNPEALLKTLATSELLDFPRERSFPSSSNLAISGLAENAREACRELNSFSNAFQTIDNDRSYYTWDRPDSFSFSLSKTVCK